VAGFRKLDPVQIELDPASGWSRRDGILPANAPVPDYLLKANHVATP
jgi:hypothetical protein